MNSANGNLQLDGDALTSLVRMREFISIPSMVGPRDVAWWDLARVTAALGADLYTWEFAHRVAIVLDRYGDQVGEVSCLWTSTSQDGDIYVNSRLMVDNCDVEIAWSKGSGDGIEVSDAPEMQAFIDDLDDGKALRALHSLAEDTPSCLSPHIDKLNGRFKSIKTVQEAIDVANSINRTVLAAISSLRMSVSTPKVSQPATPSLRM